MVLALGVSADDLIPRLREAIAGEDPARVLVLTDSLDFAGLRAVGVGFERIPAEGATREVDLERLRDRAATLLRGRRPIRAVSIGRGGSEVLGLPEAVS